MLVQEAYIGSGFTVFRFIYLPAKHRSLTSIRVKVHLKVAIFIQLSRKFFPNVKQCCWLEIIPFISNCLLSRMSL